MPHDLEQKPATPQADLAVEFVSDRAGGGAGAASGIAAQLWAWLVLLAMGVGWGLTFSLAKLAVGSGAHPLGITLWQAVIGAIMLGAIALAARRPVSSRRNMLSLYLICALLGTVVPGTLFFYAAAHVPAGVLSITVTLVPMLTVLLSALLGVERMALGRVMGVLCGLLAIVLLIAPQESLPNPAAAPWVLVACAASSCYAAENLVIAMRMPAGANPFSVACGMFIVGAMILLPIVLVTDSFVTLAWPWRTAEWSIVGMSIVSAMAYSLFIYLVHHAGPVFASQTAYVVTLAGVIWGLVIFGEEHSHWIWLSLLVMLLGLALVTPRRRVEATRPR